jgi:hypothetical protein
MSESEQEPRLEQESDQEHPKTTAARTTVQTIDDERVKKDIALEVLRRLDPQTQREVVRELQLLPNKGRLLPIA